ncbi:MAG: riboflavin kinase [Bacteroidota bacterium]
MKIHYSFDDYGTIKNPVVTTGSFDGVHLGHKVILNRINTIAKEIDGESVLITFHPHPRKILFPDTLGKELELIDSQKEKIDSLKKTGINHLFIIEFTLDFAKTSSVDFIENILIKKLHVKKVVIGFNHHFGHNREGDFDKLSELGTKHHFEFEEIPQQDVENEAVSSTKIRKALKEGNIQRANAYLDTEYMIISFLKQGNKFYQNLSIPTYNVIIDEDTKLIPPVGTYAISIHSKEGYYSKGLAIINPELATEASFNRNVEIKLFETEPNNIESIEFKILFHKMIRDNLNHASFSDLQYKLNADINFTEELIY